MTKIDFEELFKVYTFMIWKLVSWTAGNLIFEVTNIEFVKGKHENINKKSVAKHSNLSFASPILHFLIPILNSS